MIETGVVEEMKSELIEDLGLQEIRKEIGIDHPEIKIGPPEKRIIDTKTELRTPGEMTELEKILEAVVVMINVEKYLRNLKRAATNQKMRNPVVIFILVVQA